MNFIDEVVAANPSIASSYIAGQTYEKRNLKVIVLKTPTSKRSVIIKYLVFKYFQIKSSLFYYRYGLVRFIILIMYSKL